MVKPRRLNIFLHGLFMEEAALRARGLDPVNSRHACVPRMSLRIGQRATLLPDPAGTSYGILMELTHAEIDQLYVEPSVAMYRAEAVIVQLNDGSQTPALCFNLPVVPLQSEANPDDAARLGEVARGLGLPAGYVASSR